MKTSIEENEVEIENESNIASEDELSDGKTKEIDDTESTEAIDSNVENISDPTSLTGLFKLEKLGSQMAFWIPKDEQ